MRRIRVKKLQKVCLEIRDEIGNFLFLVEKMHLSDSVSTERHRFFYDPQLDCRPKDYYGVDEVKTVFSYAT
jgi:hypothetical protein